MQKIGCYATILHPLYSSATLNIENKLSVVLCLKNDVCLKQIHFFCYSHGCPFTFFIHQVVFTNIDLKSNSDNTDIHFYIRSRLEKISDKVCNVHYRYSSTVKDRILKKNPEMWCVFKRIHSLIVQKIHMWSITKLTSKLCMEPWMAMAGVKGFCLVYTAFLANSCRSSEEMWCFGVVDEQHEFLSPFIDFMRLIYMYCK